MRAGTLAALALALALGACAQDPSPAGRGKQLYLAQCTACHNSDPAKDGPVGPAVQGSSAELLEARLLRETYPSGYKPKRDSVIMRPMPHLASSISDLAAYLR